MPGSFHEFGTPEYHAYLPHGQRNPGSRAVIVIKVHMVGTVSIPSYPTISNSFHSFLKSVLRFLYPNL
jgi:hypothetical protein